MEPPGLPPLLVTSPPGVAGGKNRSGAGAGWSHLLRRPPAPGCVALPADMATGSDHLISRVLLLPSIGGFHTWDRCNKGAQSGRSLPPEGFLAAEAPATAGAHQDTLTLMGKAGPHAPPHQCGSRPREGGREGGRQPSGHCSGGADSEAWSNNGFRTSISPVGARPGHSYTVKSPSSFSSSEEAESNSLGGSLCRSRHRICCL